MGVPFFSNEFLFNTSEQALKDILSNTENMLIGNGIDTNGKMYSDVELGLKLTLQIIQQLKKEYVNE